MTWPASDVVRTNTDADTDSPLAARVDLLDLIDKFNQLRNHVSAFAQTVLDDADAAAVRSTLGVPAGSGTSTGTNTGDQTSISGITGAIAQFNTACTDADFATGGGTATGTNTGDQTSVPGSSGSCTGNAATATALQTARNINGTAFNGTVDISVNVAQANINASAVGQAQLKTAVQDIATTVNGVFALTGGEYGYWTRSQADDVLSAFSFGLFDDAVAWGVFSAKINIARTDSGTNFMRVKQRYVQASPPYDLGDGDVALFVFGLVDRSTGVLVATSISPDPPWAHNGPTSIRPDYIHEDGRTYQWRHGLDRLMDQLKAGAITPAEFATAARDLRSTPDILVEITQEQKQRDMPLIPHPFVSLDSGKHTVVILEPTGAIIQTLGELHSVGEQVNDLLHGGYIDIGNEHVGCCAPPGVMAVRASWRDSR